MLEKILDVILKSLENGNWRVLFVVIIFALIVNIKNIGEFLLRPKSRREEFLMDALRVEAIKGASRIFLEEELNSIVFRKSTGILAEKHLREKICEIYEAAKGEISIFHFQKARKHIQMRDGKMIMSLTASDRAEHIFNCICAGIIFILAIFSFTVPLFISKVDLYHVLLATVTGFVLIAFTFLLMLQTLPYFIVKRIKPIIERLQTTNETANISGIAPELQHSVKQDTVLIGSDLERSHETG